MFMTMESELHSSSEVVTARKQRFAAMRLHAIEGNPLSDDVVALFKLSEDLA